MNRLTDNDRNWGPFTVARWKNRISVMLEGGDDEDPETTLLFTCFGWALRIQMPFNIKQAGNYGESSREYGFSITAEGNGYDFFQIHYGPQTGNSDTEKSWCKHFPWKMWNHVRTSLYAPNGTHFLDEEKGKWREWYDKKQQCPKCHFGFEDYDGEMIVASCTIQEMEWHRGEGWFSWLRFFYPKKIRRSLDMEFSAESGREKGSWKGGTIGTGIDMLPGETPQQAFERFCKQDHRAKSGTYRIKFVGPCQPPATKMIPV